MAETLEIWNVAKSMKEMAEILQGAAWMEIGRASCRERV